jgi:hypothetical protein
MTSTPQPQKLKFAESRLDELQDLLDAVDSRIQKKASKEEVDCECGCNRDKDMIVSSTCQILYFQSCRLPC